MFRSKEILSAINDLNYICTRAVSEPSGDIFQKLADIEEQCQNIMAHINDSSRSEQQLKQIVKDAINELDDEYYSKLLDLCDEAPCCEPKKRGRPKKAVKK